ncbi:unnamed protein product [Acanthoscelides obtectus]|uniref:Larval cuticle protein LCP-30 n=1 Tax=Acanthoscelides obtectus TaxID=200917 RepID=A0A9P0KSL5_ACAOB|nr:unnamed protein product [Acanthoscelides obtectus]CAK1677664.1 Larval cuticle protein LCP-30 [Acanthoscelides obtectus]
MTFHLHSRLNIKFIKEVYIEMRILVFCHSGSGLVCKMRQLAILALLVPVALSAPQSQYRPTVIRTSTSSSGSGDDGQYHPDNSGAYVPDNAGAYVHQDVPYRHQEGPYGGGGGEYTGSGGAGGTGRYVVSARPATVRPIVTRPRVIATTASSIVPAVTAASYNQPATLRTGSAQGLYDNRHYNIIRLEQDSIPDGYRYLYETENGILAEEEGHLAAVGQKEEAIQARGYFTYTGPDNVVYRVDYTSDENGFNPVGDHLPTPPPIPEAILRSLEYLRANGQL